MSADDVRRHLVALRQIALRLGRFLSLGYLKSQQAMLEAHMQSAHGSVNPQSLALHRREMGRCSTR